MYKIEAYFIMILLFFSVFKNTSFYGQKSEQQFSSHDSLVSKSYKELYNSFNKVIKSDKKQAEKIAHAYLVKGKTENNNIQHAWGYYLLIMLNKNNNQKMLEFLNNAIELSKNEKDFYFPSILYLNKGSILKNNGDLSGALDSYIQGIHYAEKSKNLKHVYAIKHNIALIKRKLGKYDETIPLLKECLKFEQEIHPKSKNDSLSYLTTLFELITTYRYSQKRDSALSLNRKAIKLSKYNEINPLLKLNDGIFEFDKGNYDNALNLIKNSLPYFSNPQNRFYYENYHLIDAFLYLSKTYRALGNSKLANKYYIKTDSLLQLSNYKVPENIEVYKDIIEYFKSIDDKENQLFYINKMIDFDSIIDKDYKEIDKKIRERYDVPNLLKQKEGLIKSINNKNLEYQNLIIVLSVMSMLIFGLFFYQYRKRKVQIKKFNQYMKNVKSYENLEPVSRKPKNNVIPENVLSRISKKLEDFEKKKGF